jgi:hypothetical protein
VPPAAAHSSHTRLQYLTKPPNPAIDPLICHPAALYARPERPVVAKTTETNGTVNYSIPTWKGCPFKAMAIRWVQGVVAAWSCIRGCQ